MLKLSHIKKGYNKKDVLTDVSYTFEEGSVYSVLGNAGAGRTTLNRVVFLKMSVLV